jgi:acetoin:2,6-dichlorophenolindophenol oxidoreductase subunit alpha
MEALNVAALWKLPCILVCENNGFSEFSPTRTVTAGNIADRAKPFGVPSAAIDGNDLLEVWQAANTAVRRARAGEGPTLIEARTYRIRGHVEAESTFLAQPYREDAEIEEWRKKDPIRRLGGYLVGQGIAEERELVEIEESVALTVADAVAWARAQPLPEPDAAFQHMFA